MAVRVNLTNGIGISAATGVDEPVHNDPINRTSVSAWALFNESDVNVELTIYDSPDATSAAGAPVANFTMGPKGRADDSRDVNEVIGQAYNAGRFIIMVVDTVGLLGGEIVSKITYTEYTGDS